MKFGDCIAVTSICCDVEVCSFTVVIQQTALREVEFDGDWTTKQV